MPHDRAAWAIAGRSKSGQQSLLWGPPARLYLPEWVETVVLLVGILHQQGNEKVDYLVRNMLEQLGAEAAFGEQARCAGLLGTIFRDLEPVGYRFSDARYAELLHSVMAIFDADRCAGVPIETRIAAAAALGQARDPRIDPGLDAYWVKIPAGTFVMGAQSKHPQEPNYDEEASDDRESPVHEVQLDAYHLARYPVTVGQYNQFVEHDGYEDERLWQAGGFGQFSEPGRWDDQLTYPSRPVVRVS